ncbi:MAG: hypothetical protein GY798_09865 [Hyphomicrobiales bacterium]|nr:hypothetical protein [Hyphomicrobiales bacterium]
MTRTYTEQTRAAACVMDLYAAAKRDRRERRYARIMAGRTTMLAVKQRAY